MDEIERGISEIRFRRHLLESLLVSSVVNGSSSIPSISEYILSEVINGTLSLAYLRGGEIHSAEFRYHDYGNDEFIRLIAKYFRDKIKGKEDKLDPSILESLMIMTEPHTQSCPPDRPYLDTEIHDHFKGWGVGICPLVFTSRFSLPYDLVTKVREKRIPEYNETQRNDILGIGREMRRFIDEDLAHIGSHYNW